MLQQPLLLAPCLAVLPGLVTPPSRLRDCLGSPPSALLLFCKLWKLHILKLPQNCSLRCGWAAESFLTAPMANRDGQLHDTQVLLLVNQAKIASGLILSSHLEPHQVENQTSGRCLEHKQLQPNHIWALAFLASNSKALCVSCSGRVCDEKPFYYLWFS